MTERCAKIRKVRACVAALRGDLLNPAPEALQVRMPSLAEAIERFSGLAGLEARELADLRALALERGARRKLIEHGLTTTQVLAGILSGANAGYSSTGAPSPLAAQSKLYVQA